MLAGIRKGVRRLIKVSFYVLIAALVAATVALATGRLPYRFYVVHTGSMRPTIPPGSLVITRLGAYRIGQPVSYLKGDEVITHRLMAISANGTITTKGDANRTADPWHEPVGNIIGGVVASVPMLGWLAIYLQQIPGIASILLAVICIWLVHSIALDLGEERPATEATAA